jgi:8-oxo-dGTP pyrophosphatase MutT (NUDIX family)
VTRLLPSSGEICAREHAALRWVPAYELTELDLPEADRPIIAEYLSRS